MGKKRKLRARIALLEVDLAAAIDDRDKAQSDLAYANSRAESLASYADETKRRLDARYDDLEVKLVNTLKAKADAERELRSAVDARDAAAAETTRAMLARDRLQQSLDLVIKANARAIERWRAEPAGPDEDDRNEVLPDQAALIDWLIGKWDERAAIATDHYEAWKRATDRCGELAAERDKALASVDHANYERVKRQLEETAATVVKLERRLEDGWPAIWTAIRASLSAPAGAAVWGRAWVVEGPRKHAEFRMEADGAWKVSAHAISDEAVTDLFLAKQSASSLSAEVDRLRAKFETEAAMVKRLERRIALAEDALSGEEDT